MRRRLESRVPGSAGLGKLCRNQSSQGFRKNPRTPRYPQGALGFRSPSTRAELGSGRRNRSIHLIFFFFNLGVISCASPRGASTGCPLLWMPINFVLSLQTWATPPHARVTAPQQAARPLPAVRSLFPLAPAPFSGVRAHRSLRDPPAPSGLALLGTIQPPIVASLSQTAERSPRSYLHSRDTPWNR